MQKLENKVAIVTGATSGMGLETAKLFLKEGAKVVLTGRSQEKLDALVPELSGDYLLVNAEASSVADSEALIKKTVDTFGKIDVLFLNAGVFRIETIDGLTEVMVTVPMPRSSTAPRTVRPALSLCVCNR